MAETKAPNTSAEQLITEHLDIWTTAIEQKSSSGRGSSKKFSLHGIKKLRELILELAVRGKLVPQDPTDEPASVLLERIAAEKAQLVKDKKIKKQKPLPEISEDEKPFLVPSGWMFNRLGDVGETNIGLTYSPKETGDKGTPVLRSTNIQKGKIDLADLVRVDKNIKESAYIKVGDLLICARNGSRALVGKTAKIKELNEPMAFGAFMAIFRSNLNDFVEVFLNSPVFRKSLEGVATTTINQITQANLKSTICPIPPFEEQQRIVAKVDELMGLCDALEAQTENSITAHQTLVEVLLEALLKTPEQGETPEQIAEQSQQNWQRLSEHFDTLFTTTASIDTLKQTILQLAVMGKLVPQNPNDEPAAKLLERIAAEKAQLIKDKKIKKQKPLPAICEDEQPLQKGWSTSYMQDITKVVTCGMASTPKYKEEGRIFLSAKNVKPYKFMPKDHKFVDEETFRKVTQNANPEKGDILLTRVGAGIGEAAVVDIEIEFAFYVSLTLLKPFQNHLDSNFLLLWLNSPQGTKKSIDNIYGRGVSAGNLNVNQVRGFVVPIPPLEEQHRIVAKVDELMALCDQLKARLTDAQTTKLHLTDAIVEQTL